MNCDILIAFIFHCIYNENTLDRRSIAEIIGLLIYELTPKWERVLW